MIFFPRVSVKNEKFCSKNLGTVALHGGFKSQRLKVNGTPTCFDLKRSSSGSMPVPC